MRKTMHISLDHITAHSTFLPLILAGALCLALGCSKSSAETAAGGSAWIANGATACGKYLTPEVVSAILQTPADHPQRLDAHSCHAGSIYIELKVADINVFRQELPRIRRACDGRRRRQCVLERGRRCLCR